MICDKGRPETRSASLGSRAARLLAALAIAYVATLAWSAERAEAMCCACKSCGAGFCVDGVASSGACSSLCSAAGCPSTSYDTTDDCAGGCSFAGALNTATPSGTPTFTVTPSITATPSLTPSSTPTLTATPTITPTPTITATSTATPTPVYCCQYSNTPSACGPPAVGPSCSQGGSLIPNAACVGTSGQCSPFTPTATATATFTITQTRTSTPTQTPTPQIPNSIDPYKCYRVKPSAQFAKKKVTVTDHLGKTVTVVLKPYFVCHPSVRTGAPETPGPTRTPIHPEAFLVCYKLKDETKVPATAKRVKIRNEIIPGNDMNEETYDVLKSQLICMPSTEQVL